MLRARGKGRRPVMLAIAGDSAAGKTTLTRGLVRCLGADRMTAVCVDDYHRYDREERAGKPFTALHPDCNHIDIMEQHLQLLSMGEPILKPVYDHATGRLVRPELVQPKDFVIVEGLLPLHTRLARACFDITVYLDPPEPLRHSWKVGRDCAKRGYTPSRSGPSWTAGSPRAPPTSGPSAAGPTSWCGSPRSRAAATRPARPCPPSCCCAPPSTTPSWAR
ncbi:phosphoribulokinase [Actinomadura sp. J1-007]|uniref:phosphoribulokinase n=1 Tax=Actinomadura sp. J1-007 TaxID=2661913 RepID=UPI001F4F3706|nr:phosphoribulokinase [Actinomadura sp. J1-007]